MIIPQLPHNKPLYEQVCELIERRILEGDLRVGDKLPTEKEMAELYQVSRTVIREAMKVLKEKGWIETRVAKGTFVVNNVAKTVRDSFDAVVRMDEVRGFRYLIEVREILEPEVAALAASRADETQRDRLRQAVGSMDHALKQGDKSEEYLNADFTFHMLLAESTNNPLIPMILSPLFKLLREQQAYYSSNVKEGPSRSQVNHMKIMEAIANRDPDGARRHMSEHIHQVRTDIEVNRSSLQDVDPFSLSSKERSG
jgi:DNA-binding FadR family transcriptional regulator